MSNPTLTDIQNSDSTAQFHPLTQLKQSSSQYYIERECRREIEFYA
jgi:hypothetical protein